MKAAFDVMAYCKPETRELLKKEWAQVDKEKGII